MTCNQCSTEIKSFWIINNYLFNYNLCALMGSNKSLRHKVVRCVDCVNGKGEYVKRDLC